MSIAAQNWARELNGLGHSAKFVLIALCDYAGARGESYPSHEQLARYTAQSDDTVARRLAELCAAGLIFKTRRYRNHSGGGRRSNQYIVLFDEAARDHARELGWIEGDNADSMTEPNEQAQNSEGSKTDGNAPPVSRAALPAACGLRSESDIESASEAYPAGCGLTHEGVNPHSARELTRNCAVYTKDERSLGTITLTPPPPKGGVGALRSRFDEFKTSWPFDVVDLIEPARKIFLKLDEGEQALAVKWGATYLAAAKARNHKHMTAVNWLRGKGWQAFHAKPEEAAVSQVFIREGSPQWLAWERYHLALRDVRMPFGKLIALAMSAGRGRYEKSEWPPALQKTAERNARDGPPEGAA
jgi:hypothetical protein